MIEIILTDDSVENEPGPNLYWRGRPKDFLRLVNDLHSLGARNGGESINIDNLGYIRNKVGRAIELHSKNGGSTLIQVQNDRIVSELDPRLWRTVIDRIMSVTFYPSFQYIEFDQEELLADANWIVAAT
jgi:hypothetical protein